MKELPYLAVGFGGEESWVLELKKSEHLLICCIIKFKSSTVPVIQGRLTRMLRPPLLAGTAALFLAAPALAQNATAGPQEASHSETPKDIIVSRAFQRNRQDILSGTSLLTGTELTRQLKPTIGAPRSEERRV